MSVAKRLFICVERACRRFRGTRRVRWRWVLEQFVIEQLDRIRLDERNAGRSIGKLRCGHR